MASLDDSVAIITALLEPKLSQVIGSTPDSLKDQVIRSGLENNPKLGSQFIALSVYAASVKKSVAEEFFISKELEQLRAKITNTFVLNNKLNMTAMTLAGHCFTLSASLSSIKYINEFKKKIGGDNIWDADISKGSAGETMKKIMTQKSKTHEKAKCADFAKWFLAYTGIVKAKKTTTDPFAGLTPSSVDVTGTSKGKGKEEITTIAKIDQDLIEEWVAATGKTKEQLAKSVEDVGVKVTIARMNKDIRKAAGDDASTTVGV